MKCPNCGAPLYFPNPNQDFCLCSSCGTQVYKQNNNQQLELEKMIVKEKVLQVDQMEVFAPLVSKLRRADYEYYKRITGLKMLIDFPGYSSEVEAKIPYDTDPIAFYKWWRKGKHEHVVYLSPAYQFKLFQKVSVMEPKVMLKKDIEFVKNF